MLNEYAASSERLVVGLMSGTSVDGIDAALVRFSGRAESPRAELLAFENTPYDPAVRARIFEVFHPENATVDKVGYLNFLLGEIYARAALSVIAKAGLKPTQVGLIGSHGQTIWHHPAPCTEDGYDVRYTVQIGEGAVIAARTGIPTVSDFRVADMALGGQGAPLVPFSEYLLYRRTDETILLQNIGGIGNMTVLPAAARPEDVFAFDTGPGNMILDAAVTRMTGGAHTYDAGGAMAAAGTPCAALLAELTQDPYYSLPLPKTTGREQFGTQYTEHLFDWQRAHSLSDADLLATITDLTAWSIADAYARYVLPRRRASELIVGGGGSYNATLLRMLAQRFAPYGITVHTQEDLGLSSDAKEAVAFALMADRFAAGQPNVLPRVTGAARAAVMGKLSLPPR